MITLGQQRISIGFLNPKLTAQVEVEQQLLVQQLRWIPGLSQAGLNRLCTLVEVSMGGVDQVALTDPQPGNRCSGESHEHSQIRGQLQLTLQGAQKLPAPGAGWSHLAILPRLAR